MSVRGKGDLWPHLEIIHMILELRSQIPKCGPTMRIIAASKKCGLCWSRSDFTTWPNNADIIRIIEFVNGVSVA